MTAPQPVPARFVVPGVAPQGDQACKVCTAPYSRHSGSTCAICRASVEHHGPGEGDRLDFQACLAGRRRMASARQVAGVELDRIDLLVLGGEA